MCNLTFIPASDSITCDGSMNVMILGGTPPYTYNWSMFGGCGWGPVGSGLCAGDSCCVVITDANGCSTICCGTVPVCVYGCTDTTACNYDSLATCDDSSCGNTYGCTDITACNYDPLATCDDSSCALLDGCTDTTACNYDPTALCDDGSCVLPDGCTDTSACNYDPLAICDDGSCVLPDGCTDPLACNCNMVTNLCNM